jgi:hypothetical protein
MANVFICHRGVDSEAATRLATALSSAGHKIWLDVWEIDIGDSIVSRMNEGLTGATYLVLCLSNSGLSSWMDVEWMSSLARKLNGEDIKLLPTRLTGGNPPAILADLKYADLVQDWDGGVAGLLKAMQRR